MKHILLGWMAPQDPNLGLFSKSTPIPRVKLDLDFLLFLPNFSKIEQRPGSDAHAVSRMCGSVKRSSASHDPLKGRVTSQYTELPEDPSLTCYASLNYSEFKW